MRLHLGIGYIFGGMGKKEWQQSIGAFTKRRTRNQQNIKGNGAQRHWNAEGYVQR